MKKKTKFKTGDIVAWTGASESGEGVVRYITRQGDATFVAVLWYDDVVLQENIPECALFLRKRGLN